MSSTLPLYPDGAVARDQWVLAQRGSRVPVNADEPYAFLLEQECFSDGVVGDVATIFLTNRECPWRCVMCDLWRHTLTEPVPIGAIPRQIEHALARLPAARHVKLYNSGSFFDRGAVPPEDYGAIAELLRSFERVVVECHPALVGDTCITFRDLLDGRLEVAMGLETAHPVALEKLNKRMTLAQYAEAASRLAASGLALRSFVLVQPPFLRSEEAAFWAHRSIDFAQGCGADVVALIPTRGGNGATERLAEAGDFAPPALSVLEETLDYGLARSAGRVMLDTWDLGRVLCCPACGDARKERLMRMNLSQRTEPRVACQMCGGGL